ncbi:YkyA family protein [Fervidibacillus halotolerans]|uniref:YkyA family protein n=1 Tax=Fervidibacillus halotolerans TaxID=2980027 RepID=A0A9E8RZF8_9BACI|nr:YkyA family protein [Fervidibacillus halotolerans]WAA13876.1 YkyA family protein [Fervidibacillus halotolerans]
MKKLRFLIPFTIVLLLSGCSQSTEEKIYDILEKVVEEEATFQEQQQPLVELEKKENELYGEIIDLGLKEKEQVRQLSDEALDVLDQQKERILKEKESLEKGKKTFLQVEKLIEKLEKEDLKADGEKLYTTMNERYDVYEQLHEQYLQKIEYSKELYNLFKQEDEMSLDTVESQINKINETLKSLQQLNERFNGLTEQYNKDKVEFYRNSGLNINIKDE